MLLDTHVWVWLVGDVDGRLGARTRRRLGAARPGALTVSAASVFEIGALHTAGRLQFTRPLEAWIDESIVRSGFRVLGIDRDIATDASMIPAAALPDYCRRYPRIKLIGPPGTVAVWHSNTMRASSHNISENPRRALIVAFNAVGNSDAQVVKDSPFTAHSTEAVQLCADDCLVTQPAERAPSL